MLNILGNLFKSSNQRRVDGYEKIVKKINLKEEKYQNSQKKNLKN